MEQRANNKSFDLIYKGKIVLGGNFVKNFCKMTTLQKKKDKLKNHNVIVNLKKKFGKKNSF